MHARIRQTLFILGCCAVVIWVLMTVVLLLSVINDGCMTASAVDSPPGEDCGDTRRGAFFISIAVGVLILLSGLLMMLPAWLHRRAN